MSTPEHEVFARYPKLERLTKIIPRDVLVRNVASHMDAFESDLARAQKRIPTSFLSTIFPAEIENGGIRLERFLGHFGNLTIEELAKLCLIVSWLKPKRMLEIGTYNGMTTLNMALNAPTDCTTYTLDLSEDQSSEIPLTEMDTYVAKYAKQHFNTALGSYFKDRNDAKIVQLLGDSTQYDYSSLEGTMDLIFIDAAHDYEHKRIDSENALRLLSPRGVILWHNYNDVFCPDVTRYLADLSETLPIYHLRDTLLAVHYRAS